MGNLTSRQVGKLETIAVAWTIKTKPTSVTSSKLVIFASYKFVNIAVDKYKYTIIAVNEYKTNTTVNSIVCSEGFHYWMVFTLGYM